MEESVLRVEIDGKRDEAREGETILEVAQRNGIFIPALCAHTLLNPYGACRLCLVEAEQRGRTRIVASCAYQVKEGLVIRTATERIERLRRGVMGLLLSRCPDSEPLQELAKRLGVEDLPFPTLGEAEELCMLCGLCVRVCNEVIGASAISFAGRSAERRVDSPFSLSAEDCIGCGACAVVCPTGAITIEHAEGELKLVPFNTSLKLKSCRSCGKPIAPEALLSQIRSKVGALSELEGICPECRAAERARALADVAGRGTVGESVSAEPIR